MAKRTIQCKVTPGANLVPDSQQRTPLSADDVRRLAVPRVVVELEDPYPAVFVGTTAEISTLAGVSRGALIFDSDTKELKLYDGTEFIVLLTVEGSPE